MQIPTEQHVERNEWIALGVQRSRARDQAPVYLQ